MSFIYFCYKSMRSAGVYLIEVELGTIRNAIIPESQMLITIRIGRSSASTTFTNSSAKSEVDLSTTIQLNVDNTALETQRCSITFNGPDKRIIGIALISLPKDKSLLQNTYRLTQNDDKRAEISVKVKISPFEATSTIGNKYVSPAVRSETSLVKESSRQSDPVKSTDNILPRIYANTVNKIEASSINPQNTRLKSKISEEFSNFSSEDRKTPKSFKVREDDRVVQTTESELKRYKQEKEAYYQLYQIQKSKNEVAAKFISNVLKKISEKFPSLVPIISEPETKKTDNGVKKMSQNQQLQVDNARIDQLEQANRSLHRQVEQYKKLNEQLKTEITRLGSKSTDPPKQVKNNNFLFPGIFDFDGTKSGLKSQSNIKHPSPSTVKEEKKPTAHLEEIDFKKWLDVSIGQRESIQNMLGNLKSTPNETSDKNDALLKKLKANLDKSFTVLLTKREVTKDALISHRKEVNRLFQELVSF